MSKCLHDANSMHKKHSQIFADYNTTFPSDLTQSWNAHILKWNRNHKLKPDPYEEIEIRMCVITFLIVYSNIVTDTSMKEIRLKLAKEDTEDIKSGAIISHEITPSMFLNLGLELEEQQ